MPSSTRQQASEARLEHARARREERRAVKRKLSRPRLTPVNEEAKTLRDEWMRVPWLAMCEACGAPATERHHALREQVLKRDARTRGYDFEAVRYALPLRILLCRECHAAHSSRSRRLPFSIVRQETIDFAKQLGLLWALEDEYETRAAA